MLIQEGALMTNSIIDEPNFVPELFMSELGGLLVNPSRALNLDQLGLNLFENIGLLLTCVWVR